MFEVQMGETRQSRTVPLAILGEFLVIVALMAIPASHMPIAPILVSQITLLAPAPLPPPPPPPAGMIRRMPQATVVKKFDSAKLTAPVRIPIVSKETTLAMPDAPEIASLSDGVPGGVPGGVVGGIPGGVLGGVLTALPPVPPPPPPPPPRVNAASGPARVNVGGDVEAALLVREVLPKYPRLASAARISGTVKLKAIIACDGRVKDLTLISGPPLLVLAAEQAVMQWVYKPTLLNGVPYEVATEIAVTFDQLAR